MSTPTASNDGNTPDPYDCDDFSSAAQARSVYADEYPDNTSKLDEDGDGIPCEDDFQDQSGPVEVSGASAAAATETATATQTATATATAAETAAATDTATATESEPATETADQGASADATELSAATIASNAADAYDEIEDFNATRVSTSTYANGSASETTNTTEKLSVELPNMVRIETLAPEEQAGDVVVTNDSATTYYDASNNTVRTLDSAGTTDAANESGYFEGITTTLAESNVTYLGNATVAGQDAYALSIEPNTTATNGTNATVGGETNQTLYLSQETYFPLRTVSESSYTLENETITSRSTTTYRDVQVNVGLDDDLFTFDAPEDAERLGGILPNVSTSTYDSLDTARENTNATVCAPSDLPEGYSLENATVTTIDGNTSTTLLYTNGSEDPINDSLAVQVSNRDPVEDANASAYGENVTVNGENATYTNASGRGLLSYTTDDRQYLLSGPFSADELVSIAESITCGVEDGSTVTTENATTEDSDTAADAADTDPAYYQVDFVTGDSIENLRSDEGYYTPDRLVRFAHGDTDDGVTRVSDGEFVKNDTVADRLDTENITVENGTATITFTVSDGEPIELTLASYQKTGPGWNPQTEADQQFVDDDTETFESGTHTLTVDLPDDSDN